MTGISKLQTMFGGVDQANASGKDQGTRATSSSVAIDQAAIAGDSSQSVRVSHSANALASSAADSDVRTDKVVQLQAAIAAGTYRVSSSDVADKLIDSMLNGQ